MTATKGARSGAPATNPSASLVAEDRRGVRSNKFRAGNGDDGKHYWLTPPEVYDPLNAEFKFDFDPAPYPLPEGFDGLTCEWGASNYANIPFGSIIHQGKKKGPTAWMRKAIEENKKGKTVVLLYPVDKWILMMLKAGAEVRNMGDIRWLSTEDRKPGKGTGRHIAAFILRDGRLQALAERAHTCGYNCDPTDGIHDYSKDRPTKSAPSGPNPSVVHPTIRGNEKR